MYLDVKHRVVYRGSDLSCDVTDHRKITVGKRVVVTTRRMNLLVGYVIFSLLFLFCWYSFDYTMFCSVSRAVLSNNKLGSRRLM